jgi:Family of unknown function (DUF6636)
MPARFILACAVLLAAASLAPASAGATIRTFRSPTGKLGCAFYTDKQTPPEVRCDWRSGNDHAVRLGETGKGRRIHVTDTVLDPRARVLAYGHRMKFHHLRCTSRRSGITCRSTRSGHGFTVSNEKQRVF